MLLMLFENQNIDWRTHIQSTWDMVTIVKST